MAHEIEMAMQSPDEIYISTFEIAEASAAFVPTCLAQACGADAGLLARVEAMLRDGDAAEAIPGPTPEVQVRIRGDGMQEYANRLGAGRSTEKMRRVRFKPCDFGGHPCGLVAWH